MDFDMLQMTNSGWEIIGHMTIKELEKIAYDIEIEFELLNNVQINFDENKEDKESCAILKGDIYYIRIGIKDYNDLEKITNEQCNHICNSILHELIHARNFFSLQNEEREKIINNKMTLAHYGWKVLDKYSAYKEANQVYPETADELNGNVDDVFKAFEHMGKGILIKESDWNLYDAFYNYCSALIVRYILDKQNLLKENTENYKRGVKKYMEDLEYSYNKMPLTYKQYESLGRRLVSDLLILVPEKSKKVFKYNTHIRDLN